MEFNSTRLSRWFFVLVVAAATIYFLYQVRDVTTPFIVGGLLAYLLYRPMRFIEKQGLKRVWAIILLYVLILLVGGVFLSFALPGMIGELADMAQMIPHYAGEAQNMAERLQKLDMPMRLGEIINENVSRVNEYVYKALQAFVGGLYSFLGKILAIMLPITAFVALGFEHCVANMYLIPIGIFLSKNQNVINSLGLSLNRLSNLNIYGLFIKNLIPVTVGNIIGGAFFVGFLYWFVYKKTKLKTI